MSWPEEPFQDWDHFLNVASKVRSPAPFGIQYLFRGAADSTWSLRPSLLRALGDLRDARAALEIEQHTAREFKRAARLWDSDRLPSDLAKPYDWLTVMQHYGAPTRLLDWTMSIFVAAYFAIESHWHCDGAIWVFNAGRVFQHAAAARQQLINDDPKLQKDWPDTLQLEASLLASADAPEIVIPADLDRYWAPRMVAQQGLFTLSVNVLTDHGEAIGRVFATDVHLKPLFDCRKYVVPAQLKPVFANHLAAMNVHAAALFPSLDGFGRSLTLRARLDSFRRLQS